MNKYLPLCLLTISSFLYCIYDLDALVISPNECFMVVFFWYSVQHDVSSIVPS